MSSQTPVSILLLGSGWTSRFVIPALKSRSISHAYTKRKASDSDPHIIPFEDSSEAAFDALPKAEMVVIVFPLNSNEAVDRIVGNYEKAKSHQPSWLALGSTGAWSKGIVTSSTSTLETSARATSEKHLLSLHNNSNRSTAILNLAGLYGGGRNPANFAKKVGDTREKLEGKTSLHLLHGNDVALAIISMWEALHDKKKRAELWGKRWIVTDTHVYDWWQLFTTLKPAPMPESIEWVKTLTTKHGITSLPRPIAGQGNGKEEPPYVLDRALNGREFWEKLGMQPSVGRCDDYGPGGGGQLLQAEEQSRETL